MMGSVRDALVDLDCDVLDRSLALRQHVDDLGAPTAAQGLGHRRQRLEQGILGGSRPHAGNGKRLARPLSSIHLNS
jgi:hypothetical protein